MMEDDESEPVPSDESSGAREKRLKATRRNLRQKRVRKRYADLLADIGGLSGVGDGSASGDEDDDDDDDDGEELQVTFHGGLSAKAEELLAKREAERKREGQTWWEAKQEAQEAKRRERREALKLAREQGMTEEEAREHIERAREAKPVDSSADPFANFEEGFDDLPTVSLNHINKRNKPFFIIILMIFVSQ